MSEPVLSASTCEVVLDRVLAVARADRLVQLAEAEALEGLGLQGERRARRGCAMSFGAGRTAGRR